MRNETAVETWGTEITNDDKMV